MYSDKIQGSMKKTASDKVIYEAKRKQGSLQFQKNSKTNSQHRLKDFSFLRVLYTFKMYGWKIKY